MIATQDRLALAAALVQPGTSGRERRLLAQRGWAELKTHYEALGQAEVDAADELAAAMKSEGISVVLLSDDRYPRRLLDLPQPPPLLFYWGNLALAERRGIGMCGSRDASDRGLHYARLFGKAVVEHGLQVVSGYARGVDMETHLGALEAGGSTIIVLAEGITHFRRKRAFAGVRFDSENVLALSQFPPRQPWKAGAAMARNSVIAALSQAMLVIEARERGGTLNAGLTALDIGRPVFAIAYQNQTPAGNEMLLNRGAQPLRSNNELLHVVAALANADEPGQQADDPGQLVLEYHPDRHSV